MADVAISTPVAISKPHSPPYGLFYIAIAAVAAVLFLLELGIGSVYIPLSDVVRVLTGGEASRQVWEPIVLQFRLPRALNAAISGAALGACGLLLQTLFRNPLADPYVLGSCMAAALVSLVSSQRWVRRVMRSRESLVPSATLVWHWPQRWGHAPPLPF